MKHSLKTLSNGLRVLTVPMSSLESATVTVWVKTGSRNEEKRVNGISHFLEHMTFKGSKKRPSAKEISEVVDSIGGEFNASTSKEWTDFYIKARAGNLETAFDVLSDMVLNPILEEEEIEREKNVIVEEIRMYEDTPLYRIWEVFEELIFEGSSLGWDIIGRAESVRAVQKDDFERYRKRHYYPDNLIVTVAGGVIENDVLELTQKYFSGLSQKSTAFKCETFKDEQKKPRVLLHPKKKEQAHFILGFLADGRGYKKRFGQSVLSAILGGGMSSRLWLEVRERRGLAYAVKTSIERYQETGYLGVYAGVDPKKSEEAVAVILEQIYGLKAKKHPVSKTELEKAKEFLKGHLALALEDTKAVNGFFGEQALFLPKIETPEAVFKKVDAVTVDEVYEEAKRLFRPERLNLAIIGPYDDRSVFEKTIG